MAGMYGCFKSRNSDSAAMASGPPDVMANQEPAEGVEECSGKKKSKFQTFKKFFARKKRKEPPAAGADAALKGSQSSDNVSKTSENNTLTRSEKEKGSGSKISLGSKALSHDSVFVSDSSEANEALGASQDNIHGKVKSLQLQLRQAIRLGSPPSLMCMKKTDDGGAMSEDDGLPCSPPELTTLHTAMAERNSTISLEGIDTDDDQLSCAASSRAVSPLVVPGDFSQPASPFGCLDNSAAKHKLGLRHKACNRRRPVRKLELKADGDSEVDTVNTSVAEASEEQHQQKSTEVVSGDELKPKVDKKEDEEEEEEEEEEPDTSRLSLSRDEAERKEEEDESRAEQDVSPGLDSSSPPEEEAPDVQPSSKPSSRASSLDSPRATPEPPAGQTESSLDAPCISYGAEETGVEGDLALIGEEDGVQESKEEESSFLQEVLSSLKTPLSSSSLGRETEGVVLEIQEEVKEKEREDVEREEGEEVKEDEAEEEEEAASYQAAPAGSLLSDQTTEEEEEEEDATLSATSYQDVEEEEEKVEDKEEEVTVEEGELVVARVSQHVQQEEGEKEEAEEVTPKEQNDMMTGHAVNQAVEEGREEEESEEDEGAIELEKEPEVEEVGGEKREEEVEVKEATERVETERDSMEEETEMCPDAAGEDVAMQLQEEDEVGDVVGDEAVCTPQHTDDDDETELGDAAVQESQAEERGDGEEEMEEGVEINHLDKQQSEQEEDQSEDVQQEDVETSHLDMKQVDHDDTERVNVSSKPPPLSLPESHHETQPQESGAGTPSKTTTIHINLLSPSSDKSPSFFQQSQTEAHPETENEIQQSTASREEEEPADDVEALEEEKHSDLEEEATPPAAVEEEEVTQLPSGSDQSKAQFTISPAWQRSLSGEDREESSSSPSSPPACFSPSSSAITGHGGVEVEATTTPEVKAEPASPSKVEVVLSPGRVRSAGTITTSPSPIQPQTSAAASTESSVIVEGNPDNPFGVRLRKTSALHRFSSEEENSEPPVEPPAQPISCKVDSAQPISVKSSISPPVSSKPTLPKKPDVHGDSGGKNKRLSDPAAGRGVSGGSDSPSWISVAKQKQKIYKENSLEEITVRKEEPERKSSLPMYVSSAASKEHSNRTAESTGKVSLLELSKPSAFVEKEARRSFSPPTPVPPQPPKSQSAPCPIPPKPQLPSAIATAKHTPQPSSPQRSLSPTSPTPVPLKSPSCMSPLSPSKTSTQSTTLTSPPFSSRTTSQTPASQRGLPPPASPQDEPPWMALAKKKAKAWSEMPQIVQ